MIFVTVGVQLPFDRLIRCVDEWAGRTGRTDVVVQAGRSDYKPRHVPVRATVPPPEFRRMVEEAEVIVAHAGMGSVITALQLGKPIIVMPRRASLGEHRNEHQLATARHLAERRIVTVAMDEGELSQALDSPTTWRRATSIGAQASDQLLTRLKTFASDVAAR